MATFAELWDQTEPAVKTSARQPANQADREAMRTQILQNELQDTQARLATATDPQVKMRLQGDVDALNREMGLGKKIKQVPQPVTQAAAPVTATSENFADLWESTAPSEPAQTTAAGGGRGGYEGYSPTEEAAGKVKAMPLTYENVKTQPTTAVKQILSKAIKGALDVRREVGERAAGALEPIVRPVYEVGGTLLGGAAGSVLGPAGGLITSIQSGKLGTPEGVQIGQQKAEDIQRALMPEVTTSSAQAVLGGLQKGFEATKLPPNIMPELMGFTPLAKPATQTVIAPIVKGAEKVAEAAKQTKIGQQLTEAAKDLEFVRPAAVDTGVPGQALTKEQLAAQFAERQKQATQEAAQPTPPSAQPPVEPLTGQPLGTAKPTAPEAPFTELKYAETGLPVDEQMARAQTLNRVMGPDFQADMAAIQGKGKERATNYATSNTDTSVGNYLKDKFTDEQNRLSRYMEDRIKETGGTVGLDESSVYKRGNVILKPLQDLETYFDNATADIYKKRDAKAKEVPVIADNILSKLNDRTLVEISDPAERLAKTAKVKMQQLGMIDEAGNPLPTDAYHAELFRKWLNQNWSREANQLHKALKGAVDDDVIANLDTSSPLYKDARALVELRKNTLDNPKGISNILDAEGPKGINRKVQIEKIAQNIADMPVEQFTHVIDTLKNVPEALRPSATAALSEIKAQFANQLAAKKTPKQITDFMNANSEVMNRLFTPDEMGKLRDYHNASHILATDTGYKGAAVQKINVEKKLGTKVGEQLLQKGAAAGAEFVTGGAGMGVPAVVTHEVIGGRLAKREAKRQAKAEEKALKATQERFVPLGDLLPPNQ